MKRIITLLSLLFIGLSLSGQCSDVGLSVSSSDTAFVQLYHPGFFLIDAGADNVCEWEISTFSGSIVFQDTTQGGAFEQGLLLFDHSVPLTDSMKATVVITNEVAGIVCTISDTLFWEKIEVIPGSFIGNWAILSQNGGMEMPITSTQENVAQPEAIQLFPVPAHDYFQIRGIGDAYQLRILNKAGQVLQSMQSVRHGQKVEIANLPPDLYIVQVWNKDNQYQGTKKLIKL